MSWFYAEENQRRGPVDEAAFADLVRTGAIGPATLVWREGMADWLPYREVAQPAGASSPASMVEPAVLGGSPPTAERTGIAVQMCSQCSRLFPPDEMVMYEGHYVCAECKPLFFQKLREGAPVNEARHYAGFWIRALAKFLDGILLFIVNRVVVLVTGLAHYTDPAEALHPAILLTSMGVGILIGASYNIFFVGRYGATPGKMALRLRIIRSDGEALTYGRACGRYFAEMLSGFTLSIGYLIAAFDAEKRALHDHICDTRVIWNQ